MSWLRKNALFIAVAILATVPLLLVRHPPMQDLPIHIATARVLHEYGDPASGFSANYDLTLGRTQYTGFYGTCHAIAYVIGPRGAVLAFVVFVLVGTLAGLRSLLLVLGRDERLAFVALPALYGPLLTIGLLPFLVAMPVLFFGLAVLLAREREPTTTRHVAIVAISIGLFYLHVLQFGLFLFAAMVFFPLRRKPLAALASLVPGFALGAWWALATNAGRRVLDMGVRWGSSYRPPLLTAVGDMVTWLTDSFPDPSDEIVCFLALGAIAWCTISAYREGGGAPLSPRRYAILPLVCIVLYLTGERSRGAVWPLGPRYMLPAALLAIPLLAMPRDAERRKRATIAILTAGMIAIANVGWHWRAFEKEDVGDFEAAIASIAPNHKVATILFHARSKSIRFWPLLHFGSYYQAEKRGVSYFTFAGYDHWPIDFKAGRYPVYGGPATPRWEIYPVLASRQPLATYFDEVLIRDRKDESPPAGFHRTFVGDRWEVYARDSAQ